MAVIMEINIALNTLATITIVIVILKPVLTLKLLVTITIIIMNDNNNLKFKASYIKNGLSFHDHRGDSETQRLSYVLMLIIIIVLINRL